MSHKGGKTLKDSNETNEERHQVRGRNPAKECSYTSSHESVSIPFGRCPEASCKHAIEGGEGGREEEKESENERVRDREGRPLGKVPY